MVPFFVFNGGENVARYDGSIRINTNINTRGLRQGESEIRGSMGRISGVVKKFAGVMATAFAVGKIVQFGKEATRLGSELQEVENIVSVAFPNMTKEMEDFASSVSKSFGLSESMAKRYSSLFGTMAKQFNFTEKEAFEIGTTLAALAGDVASFYDISQDLAYIKLKSVFSGETETLKDIGVVMTEAALNQYALANGINKTVSKMTEQEKVALRYKFVLEQLSQASGDFIRTSDSWANQTRMLKLQIDSLMATIGKGLINVFTPVIKTINVLLEKLTVLANAFKSFTELLTGRKAYSGSGAGIAAAGGLGDVADDYNNASDAAGNLADSTQKVADATKKAQKAAEGYLSPLDDINKFSMDNTAPSAGNDGSGIGGAVENVDYGNLAEGETVVDKLDEKLLALKEILSGLIRPFKEAWDSEGAATIEAARFALSSLGELAKSVAKSFYEVWTNGTGTQTLTLILQIAQNVLMTIGNIADRLNVAWNTNSVGTSIIQNIFNIYNTILGTIERITGATAEWASKLDFYPLLESINGLLESVQPLTQNIGDGLAWFYENVLLPIAGWTIQEAVPAFLDMLSAAIGTANEVIEALKPLGQWLWDEFLQPLGEWAGEAVIFAMETITDLLKKFGDWVSEHQEVINGFAITLGVLFSASMAADILSAAASLGEYIINAGGLVAVLKSTTASLVANTAAWFSNIAAKIADKAETLAIIALYAKDFIVNLAKGTAELVKQAAQFAISTAAKIADTAAQVAMTAATVAWNAVCALATAATTAFGAAVAFLTSPIGIAIVAIGAIIAIGVLLYKNWDTIKEKAKEVWDFVKKKFQEFDTFLHGVFTKDWTNSFGALGNILNAFFKNVSNIWNSIKQIFNGIITFIKGVFSGNWRQAWNGIKQIFKGVWDGLVSVVKSPINHIIGILNGLLSGMASAVNGIADMLNSLSFDIPDWLGGGSLSLNLPKWTPRKIPYLATGTVVPPNREFMAVLGDNKREPEVVSPLSTIEQAMENVMARHGGSGAGGNGNVTLQVILDRKVLAESTLTWGEIQQMSTGKNPFMLGTT